MAQSKFSIVEAEQHHQITVLWSLTNFLTTYRNANGWTIAEEEFSIGDSKWTFRLEPEENQEDLGIFGIFLDFHGSSCFSAEYSVYLKSSDREFILTYKSPLHKYAKVGSNIEGALDSWGKKDWMTLSELRKRFLQKDELQMKIAVSVYTLNYKRPLKNDSSEDFKSLLDSGRESDVIFSVVDESGKIEKIKAHRLILSLRSSVFATMFGIEMKEATEGEVKIDDITPKAFKVLLEFIYSGELDGEWGSVAGELFYGADKYDLKGLRAFLCENVDPVLTVRNIMGIRNLAKLQNLPQEVQESAKKFIIENFDCFLDNATLKDD